MSSIDGRYPPIAAGELQAAVANKLLTQEEARLIYWSNFPILQHQASVTPPEIKE